MIDEDLAIVSKKPTVSVCIATYNGGKYIREQLDSVLSQLNENDEVIISDDCSNDDTLEIVNSYNDIRISTQKNNCQIGYIRNFEKLLNFCKGEYIFLCDQDDVWPEGRLDKMIGLLDGSGKSVLVGNQVTFTGSVDVKSNLNSQIEKNQSRSGVANIFSLITLPRIPYYGCCMLLNRRSLTYLLPFRSSKVSHDIWIAIASNCRNDIAHSSEVVLYRRLHSNNVTKSRGRSLFSKIKDRISRLGLVVHEYSYIIITLLRKRR